MCFILMPITMYDEKREQRINVLKFLVKKKKKKKLQLFTVSC